MLAPAQNLDFDFEKCCSVSLSAVNVYACLVCGVYFQGRGAGTHAHTHSVEDGHHLFIKLENGRVFCIPDNYEVQDRSLKDIQHVLNPLYTASEIANMGRLTWARTLDDADYMPGLVGLNNMKRNDYLNVILQCLLRVPALRCACPLLPSAASCACPPCGMLAPSFPLLPPAPARPAVRSLQVCLRCTVCVPALCYARSIVHCRASRAGLPANLLWRRPTARPEDAGPLLRRVPQSCPGGTRGHLRLDSPCVQQRSTH